MENGREAGVNANLSDLHEAITTARSDRDDCLHSLLKILTLLNARPEQMVMLAKLDGNIHELDLLQRRELALITHGKETA